MIQSNTFPKENCHRKIVDKLKSSGCNVYHRQTVSNVLRSVGIRRTNKLAGLPQPVKFQPQNKASRNVVKKTDALTSKENPRVQIQIATVNLSRSHLGRIIKTKLHKKVNRRPKFMP